MTFVGVATVDAIPGVIASQEGGSGPGSALLLGQAVQAACTVLGGVLSIATQRRHALLPRMDVPAVMLTLAVGAVVVNEHADLGWIVFVGALAGLCLGWLLTAALLRAMSAPVAVRPACVGLVLSAPVVARVTTRWLGAGGLVAIAVAAVALTLAAVETRPTSRDGTGARAGLQLPRGTLIGAGVVAVGVVPVLAGVDPSRVLTTMLARPIGIGFDAIDSSRSAFLLVGAALVLGGSVAVVRRSAIEPPVVGAIAGLVLLSLTASGAGALLVASVPAGPIVPSERTVGVVALAGLVGTGAGITVAALTGVAHRRPSITAAVGAAILTLAVATVAAHLSGYIPHVAKAGALNAAVGFAAGMSSAGLWLSISGRRSAKRGWAVAMGTAAVAVGLALGPSVARSAAASTTAGGVDLASGGLVVGIAGAAALAAVVSHAALPGRAQDLIDTMRRDDACITRQNGG